MANGMTSSRRKVLGFDVPEASTLLVLGALGFLIAVRKGFRGVSI